MEGSSLLIPPTTSFYVPLPTKKSITDKRISPINGYRPLSFPEPSPQFRTPILCARIFQKIAFQNKSRQSNTSSKKFQIQIQIPRLWKEYHAQQPEWILSLTKHFIEDSTVSPLFQFIQHNIPLVISTDGSKSERKRGRS